MATLANLGVEIDFASGPAFGYPFTLDDPASLLDFAILADAPSDIVDITDQVLRCSTRRGRNRILSNFEAGTATVVLNDPNGDFNPQNPSSPYYGKLLPLRKIRIYADVDLGGVLRFYIFSGYITTYDTGFYEGTNATSTVTLQCVDGFRLLANVSTDIPPVPGTVAGELSGARVNALLDYADWPSSLRSIDNGDSTMQADPGGNRSVLQALQTVEQSEFGAFYIQPDGVARFLDRTDVSQLADIVVRTYSDTGAAGTLPYTSIDTAFDDQLILNDVTVTRLGGVPQIVIDQDSVDTYFYKSGQRTDILVETDAEALDQARTLVATRKDAKLRIDSMTINLNNDDAAQNVAAFNADIYKLVKIIKTMPGGSTITSELFIQGIQHDITPNTWNVKLFTAEPIIEGFILDSTTQGVLDINALSY
jgi:hypothetical protein